MSPQLSIGQLNDLLRTTFLTGTVILTPGIRALPDAAREEVISKVRTFDEFTPDNDPHGERDFGSFKQEGIGTVFWKIDYYDTDYRYHSPDPSDPHADPSRADDHAGRRILNLGGGPLR